jgi:GAF domain-containing protein
MPLPRRPTTGEPGHQKKIKDGPARIAVDFSVGQADDSIPEGDANSMNAVLPGDEARVPKGYRLVRTGMTATFLVVLVLCAGAAGFAVRYKGANAWVNHTTAVIAEIRETRAMLPGTPVLSGKAQRIRVEVILEQFGRVADLTRDNPRQQQSVADFRAVFAAPQADANGDGPRIDAVAIAAATVILDRMSAEEYQLLTDRIRLQSDATRDGAIAVCALCAVQMLLGVETGVAARREFRGRSTAERLLMEDKEELTSHNPRLALVSAGSEMIQAARDEAQINEAVARAMRELLPGSRGYFGIVSPSSTMMEICAMWGEGLNVQPFAPSDCVALQLGRPVFRSNALIGMECRHAHTMAGESACIPVGSATGPLGVQHFETEEALHGKPADVLGVFAVHVGLGLTNLRMREALRRQTVRDPVTGLFNRRYFDETLRRELNAVRRHGLPVSVLMLDIDHFKPLNDT